MLSNGGTENIYKFFFDNSIDLLCVANTNGIFEKLNPEWEKTLGYKLSELEGQHFIKFVHPDDIEDTIKTNKVLSENKEIHNFRNRYRHKNGSYLWIEWRSYPTGNKIFATARDVTENIQKEEALKQSEEINRLITSSMVDYVLKMEIDEENKTKLFHITNNFEEPGKLKTDTISEIYSPKEFIDHDDEQKWDSFVSKLLSNGNPDEMECRSKINGTKRWINISAAPHRDKKSGQITTIYFAVKDISEKKKAEANLLKSQSILSNTQRIAGLGSWELVLHGLSITLNKQAYKILGIYDDGNPLNIESLLPVVHPDDKNYVKKICDKVLQTNIIKDFEFRIIRENNEIINILVGGEVIYDDKKVPERIIGIVQDITKQKHAEVARQENLKFLKNLDKINRTIQRTDNLEQLMKDVLDDALDIFKCDRAFLLYPLDPKASTWKIPMERTTKEFPGLSALGKPFPVTDQIRKLHIELLGSETLIEYHLDEFPDKELWSKNHIKSILTIAVYPKVGKPWQFGIQQCSYIRTWKDSEKKIFMEISRRLADGLTSLLMYHEKQENEEFLNKIFENIPNMIFVKDAKDLNFVRINKAGEKLLGYKRNEIIGKNEYDFLPKNTANFISAMDKEVLKSNKQVDIPEEIIHNKQNKELILHTKKLPLLDESGNPKYLIGISEDITEKKKAEIKIIEINAELEKRVNERTAQLEHANKELESFAYSVSHDLRAPLRHIDGFVQLMYSNISEHNDKIKEYYNRINSASKRMSEMIDELLNFSRLGRKVLNIAPVDLNKLVIEIIDQLKPDFKNRKINWNINELSEIQGDAFLLKIVFGNLISNAIKYTSKKPEAIIEIGTKKISNKQNTIYINDNGAGFDMKYVDKLFGVFQRLHSNDEFEGVGIGLANVKQIISKHKGTITVESEIDKGTTFYINLPKVINYE